LVPLAQALEAAAARVDRRLLLVRREHLLLAALVVQGELQALGVPEVQFLYLLPPVLAAAAVVEGLIFKLVLGVLEFR